jgi:hypothetical protein
VVIDVGQVDRRAAALRSSTKPRHDLADALDWLNGEWAASGYAAPVLVVHDWLRTLSLAAHTAEAALEATARGPVDDPWPVEECTHGITAGSPATGYRCLECGAAAA